MPEAAVKAYSKEAEQLFQRGMAAARGGQRRIAAGLLTRAVQLDPRHEAAWLWLSGVLDDPHDVAFCLQAALRVNPNNQRALQALQWLQDRKLQAVPAPPASTVRSIDLDPVPPQEPEPSVSWWIQFRASIRAERLHRAARLAAVVVLYSVVVLTVLLYRQARARAPIAVPEPLVVASVADRHSLVWPQQRLLEPPDLARSRLLGYLSQVEAVRQRLRVAQQEYRSASESGGTAVSQVTAVHTYRDRLLQASADLEQIAPPGVFEEAHSEYLTGLQLEQQALDDLLQFYSEYHVALANRAALRLQEANLHLSRARAIWDAYSSEIATQSSPPPFSAR